jgi:hypothetical protein
MSSASQDPEARRAYQREYYQRVTKAKQESRERRQMLKREWTRKFNQTNIGKAYQHAYYLRVTKPKRAAKAAAKLAAWKQQVSKHT